MSMLHISATIFLVCLLSPSIATEASSREVRCFFDGAPCGFSNDGDLEDYCIQGMCKLALVGDICERNRFGARCLSSREEEDESQESATTTSITKTATSTSTTTSTSTNTSTNKFQESSADNILPECLRQPYNLGLFINGHLFVTPFRPTKIQVAKYLSPKMLAFAATSTMKVMNTSQPSLSILGADIATIVSEEVFPLDVFILEDILTAFEVAVVSIEEEYNIMSNNSETFVLSIMTTLDMDSSEEATVTSVVDQLMQHENIMDSMRDALIEAYTNDIINGLRRGRRRALVKLGGRIMVDMVVRQYIRHFRL